MASTPYVQRYVKVVSSLEMPTCENARRQKLNEKILRNIGAHTYSFYNDMCHSLIFQGEFGEAILYPVRVADVYILSLNGNSMIFDCTEKLYDYMVQKGIVEDSDSLRKRFKGYTFIDPFMVSFHAKARLKHMEVFDLVCFESDITEIRLPDKVSFYAYIPCIFEDKGVILAFIKTTSITDEIEKKLKKAKMRKIDGGFMIPYQVVDEMFERLGF